MASIDLHVNGPAFIEVAFGANGSFTRLGVTVDGPDVEEDGNYEDVTGDDAGPFIPTDVQFFGVVATIRTEMIRWDDALMRNVEGRIKNSSAGLHTLKDIGTLLIAGDQIMKMRYTSAARTGLPLEPFRQFEAAYPLGVISYKPATRVTRKTINWRAIPLTPIVDGKLYTIV